MYRASLLGTRDQRRKKRLNMMNGDVKPSFTQPIDAHSVKLWDLLHFQLTALDGDIGHVSDFYFDDQNWVIRYLVVNTGSWLTGRQVLLSPHAFGALGLAEKKLYVKLYKKQIEYSPTIEMHKPVSRQYEADYYRYYGWPTYWAGSSIWGLTGTPFIPFTTGDNLEKQALYHHREDKHLQSINSIIGYQLHTNDGPIGRVKGFRVDDRTWMIRDIVVNTGHWYAGKEILISPTKVLRIRYDEAQLHVSLTRSEIEDTGNHAHALGSLTAHPFRQ
jgi:hypothetical protein